VVGNVWNKRQQRYEAVPNLGKNCAIDFSAKTNQEFSPQSEKSQRRMGRELM